MALWYAPAVSKMLNKEIDYIDDSIKATLHTSLYTPNRDTHDYVDDLTNELATGAGYTQGGEALATKTVTTTAANSWSTTWASNTAYTAGKVIRPVTGNGLLYRCVTAGTSAGAEPTWPTVVGKDVTDGSVVWECVGRAIVVITCATISWALATFTGARYCVLSDRTPGTAATQPLIGLIDFGADKAGGGGNFDIVPDPQGLLRVFIP